MVEKRWEHPLAACEGVRSRSVIGRSFPPGNRATQHLQTANGKRQGHLGSVVLAFLRQGKYVRSWHLACRVPVLNTFSRAVSVAADIA